MINYEEGQRVMHLRAPFKEKQTCEDVGECNKGQQVRDAGSGKGWVGIRSAGGEKVILGTVSPKQRAGDESAEEEAKARAREAEAVPAQKEINERNVEHATLEHKAEATGAPAATVDKAPPQVITPPPGFNPRKKWGLNKTGEKQ